MPADPASLERELAHLRAQREVAPVGVFFCEPSGACVYVNRRWTELSGLSAEEALGEGWARAIHPEDRERVLEVWGVGAVVEEPPPIELRFLRPDGQVVWVLALAAPLYEDGAAVGLVGSVTDVTAQKQVQEALLAEQELSGRIVSCSMDGILAFDREARYTVWNPAMEVISGVPASEVVGNCAFDVFPFLKEIGEDRYFYDALEGKHSVVHDRPFEIPSTGRQGFFEAHYAPLRDASGEVIGGLGVVRDITEQKQAFDALKSAQMQVVQSGKLAAMGQLGAGIAHELNQPLTGMKMILTLMDRDRSQPVEAFAEELRIALQQVDRMARIVDNVRGFARESEFTPIAVPPLRALDDALMLMSEQLRLSGVEVVKQVEPALPQVLADGMRLQQVFLNLLSNALHALEDLPVGRPRQVVIGARRDGAMLEYRLRDNGPGVPAGVAQQIFDPFFTTKETGIGTGLGLSLSYGIVKEHAGSLTHEVPDGGGACFVVRLPVAGGVASSDQVEALPAAPQPTAGCRVLVVDDEQVMRSMLSNCLEHLGADPVAVPSAAEAREALAARTFDLALVDMRMPGTSGLELCAQLAEERPGLQVVAMSGFATEEARAQLEALGVEELLAKPFGMEALRRVLEGCCRNP